MNAYNMPGHLIRRLHQISTSVFQTRAREAGVDVTPVQFAAMEALREFPGIDQAGLAASIFCDRPTIGGVIDRLITKGFVERVVSEKDRRAREVRLTNEGIRVFDEITTIVEQIQNDILSNLTPEERQLFIALSSKAVAEKTKEPELC